MAKITLYGFNPSPPTRAVVMTLVTLDLPYTFVEVNVFKKEQLSEEYRKKNPQHTIPMLEDDGVRIWESHAIMTYLVSKYGKDDSLYPKDLLKRAVVDQRMYFEASVLFADALRPISRNIFFFDMKVIPKERIQAIADAYDFVETFLRDHDYIAGDQLTIADFSVLSTVSSLPVFLKIDAIKYPRITAWIKRLEDLPFFGHNECGAEQYIASANYTNFTIEQ